MLHPSARHRGYGRADSGRRLAVRIGFGFAGVV